jgi:two-component system sensor histidine kinase KdpD
MPAAWRHLPSPVRGVLSGAALVLVLTALLLPLRADLTRAGPALVLVLPVVGAGLVGGRSAALSTAFIAAAAFNFAFIPPYWTFQIDVVEDALALVVFMLVGLAIGTVVAREAERRAAAELRATELEALHRRNAKLSEERERLADEAARLLEETNRLVLLEQIDDQRSALLRSVSHDLRTPLAAIRAVTSDLRAGTSYDDATRDELLDIVGDEAERLDRIVANLLNLSRIEAGALKPDRQAVAVDELVTACVRRLRRLLGKVRLQIDVPAHLPLADADYSQLDQVLTNILENAVRHSPPGSTVRVDARARGGFIEIAVSDEGPGLLPFERHKVLTPFRRGGNSSSGVGLTICKAIVEAHGGTILVEDAPAGGARFTFTVPVRDG